MTADSRYFPVLAIPGGTANQVLTAVGDNTGFWADPTVGTGPVGPQGPVGPVGPAGAAGATGATGAAGVAGSQLLTGSGAPAGGLGVVNDFYVDSVTNSYYKKTGPTTWTLVGTFGSPLALPGLAEAYGYSFATGCGTVPIRQVNFNNPGGNGVSGALYVSYFRAPKSFTSTQVKVTACGDSVGQTFQRLGLYSVDASQNLTALIASTVNDASLLSVLNQVYTKSWSASVSLVAGTMYAFAYLGLASSAAAQPYGVEHASFSFTGPSGFYTAVLYGQSSLPSSVLVSSYDPNSLLGFRTIAELLA